MSKYSRPPVGPRQAVAKTTAADLQAKKVVDLIGTKDWESAEKICRQILTRHPTHPDALHLLALVYKMSKRPRLSLPLFEEVIRLYPKAPFLAYVHNNYGNALREIGALHRAVESLQRAIALNGSYSDAYNNLGITLQDLGRFQEAEVNFRQALAINPRYSPALNNLGGIYQREKKLGEALQLFQQALAVQPENAEALYNLGNLYSDTKQLPEAVASFRKSLAVKPDYAEALISLLRTLQTMCAWKEYESLVVAMRAWVNERDDGRIFPFAFVGLDTTGQEQLRCAALWAKNKYDPLVADRDKLGFHFTKQPKDKLRIGYLSSDLRNHAVAFLIAEIFELHDRDHFEVIAYSASADDGLEMRQRLLQAFDRFVDILPMSPEQAARQIYADGIDILVDLTGYTKDTRSSVLAFRPAPIQVNYLGYPGTMGWNCVDYILTDRYISPPEMAGDYAEHLAYLPYTYQANDRKRPIGEPISREACGLPEDKLVFCCFNHNYKITAEMFSVWCRLLQAVPGSVMWLLKSNDWAEQAMRTEAVEHYGIEPDRLVFAPNMPLPEHLSRIRNADLFLDTYPYNAHTTTSDALWATLPVVTYSGSMFASRVAGSLLRAAGLPELVAHSPEEYFNIALNVATQPGRLAQLRRHLVENRMALPVFDSTLQTRALEKRYRQMWEAYLQGTMGPLTDPLV